MHVTAIRRYPVKSLRGEDLTEAEVEPWGLAGDRRWMVVDDDGWVITARQVNAMLLVRPTITDSPGGLLIEAPDDLGISPLQVPTPDPSDQQPVGLWSSELTAAPAGAEADSWLSKVLGVSAHLVHLDDPRRRPSDPRFSREGDVVSFADGYPLLVTTEESLAAVNDALLERTGGLGEPLPMVRFRPSLVVSGDAGDLAAWDEDDWRRVRVGGPDGVELRLVKGCARCVMTTVDPETGQRGKEPTATLARVRRFDGATWFGVNAIPDLDPASDQDAPRRTTIRVGDPVELLESVPPGAGPLR